jgi:hypothetical protein
MRWLALLLISCSTPTDLGDAQSLTPTTLRTYLDRRVTVHGTPTPTRTVEITSGDSKCLVYYYLGNRKLFVMDCASETPPDSSTGHLRRFSTLPSSDSLVEYYASRFDISINPSTTFVIIPDS